MSWMILPILACVVIVLTLGWFGLHVLERGVIFVDLALAQVAALGTTWAVYLGHEPDSPEAFGMALLFTLVGAAGFSASRLFESRVPQEALIGIAYAVSAAAGILMIHFAEDAHGGEKLEHLLVGNLVWVQPDDLMVLAASCGLVGLLHLVFRERFLQISYHPDQARAEGRSVVLWDILFYSSFGVALTAIVSVSGVILVFSYLVIPAVIARLHVGGVLGRLLTGWGVGLLVSVAGVSVSYTHPTGPVIVVFFGIVLGLALLAWLLRMASRPGVVLGQVLAVAGALGLGLWGTSKIPATHADHGHEEHEHDAPANAALAPTAAAPTEAAPTAGTPTAAPTAGTPTAGLSSTDANVRDAAARAASTPEQISALNSAIRTETDSSVKLVMAVVLARAGQRAGVTALVELVGDEAPFVRMEADARLRVLAGATAPAYDPLAAPDTGVWAAWAQTVDGVPATAAGLVLP